MVKISDIAEKAGVSVTAVSLVLNNRPGIGKETKNRILQIAEELSYVKSNKYKNEGSFRLMRIVKHGHTLNKDHDYFLSHYIEHITRFAQAKSFDLQLISCQMEELEQKLKKFSTDGVNGIIIIGTELTREDVKSFAKCILPIVFIDTFYPGFHVDFVNMDNTGAVYDIIELLFSKGHRNIGLVTSPVDVENFRLRERAFHAFMLENNLAWNNFEVDSTYEGSQRDFKAQFQQTLKLSKISKIPNIPSALFCVNDIIALGCIHALNILGYQVPQDISVVGFDNLLQARMASPTLTSVQVNHEKISEYAIRLLFDRIASSHPKSRVQVSVGTSLILRESVKDLTLRST